LETSFDNFVQQLLCHSLVQYELYGSMKKEDKNITVAAQFLLSEGDNKTCFKFEEDFIEENIRCIPMIVRFKLDACGIKLKLSEWSKMKEEERISLVEFVWDTKEDVQQFRGYLQMVIFMRTGKDATVLPQDNNAVWANNHEIPLLLTEKMKETSGSISLQQWKKLSMLQRFALMKLCKPGHENSNFPKAIKEFGLI
jgi:hypothetical protein